MVYAWQRLLHPCSSVTWQWDERKEVPACVHGIRWLYLQLSLPIYITALSVWVANPVSSELISGCSNRPGSRMPQQGPLRVASFLSEHKSGMQGCAKLAPVQNCSMHEGAGDAGSSSLSRSVLVLKHLYRFTPCHLPWCIYKALTGRGTGAKSICLYDASASEVSRDHQVHHRDG
jgi:hypothetical protein